MGCQKALDFAVAGGAHLSLYWTMDEAGAADKVDSVLGVHWPLRPGTLAAPALFSNGTQIQNNVRGLRVVNDPNIVVSQATSTGISFWYWVKVVSYGSTINNGVFCDLDTSGAGFNEFDVLLVSLNASTTTLEIFHYNGVDLPDVTSAPLSWTLGSWHMVAGVYDKTAQTITAYADAVAVATTADTFIYPDLLTSVWALNTANPLGVAPNMIFDELGLCLNGALTQAQITALYNGGAGLTWPNITPIVPYP